MLQGMWIDLADSETGIGSPSPIPDVVTVITATAHSWVGGETVVTGATGGRCGRPEQAGP